MYSFVPCRCNNEVVIDKRKWVENGRNRFVYCRRSPQKARLRLKITDLMLVVEPYPNLKNIFGLVNWDDDIPNIWENNPVMFQ